MRLDTLYVMTRSFYHLFVGGGGVFIITYILDIERSTFNKKCGKQCSETELRIRYLERKFER